MRSKVLYAAFVLGGLSCTKTARVAVEPPPAAELGVPAARPSAPIPPIENDKDLVLQNDEVEAYALEDAFKLSDADKQNTIYLSAANFVNNGDNVAEARGGTELGLNLLSTRNFIERARPVDPSGSIYAVDLRDFFGSRSNAVWKLIEDQAVVKIVSQTARFQNLQFVTQKQIPLMHAQIFIETAFLSPVYYAIKQTPLTENEFWLKEGINRQQDFDDRDEEILLAGFQDSLIGPDNRVVRRMFGANGACWNTYDVDSLQLVAQSNFSKFPFVPEARSRQTLIHNAGEILCRQPNGLYSLALYDGAGVRQDVAPTTVVVNTRTAALGLDPSITLRDCSGCHTQFVLPLKDEFRRQIAGAPFAAEDKELAEIFFKPQSELNEQISKDNIDHEAALQEIELLPGGSDPMNVGLLDPMRDGFTAKELASFLYLTEAELLEKISGSQLASSEVGQLLQGGTISFGNFQGSIQVLIDDLNLFKDLE